MTGVQEITREDLVPLALGAAFLATGGGGDPLHSRLAAERVLDAHGPVALVPLAQVAHDSTVISVGMSGSPSVAIEKLPNGGEPAWALAMLERHIGRRADALISFEVGGGNSIVPLLAAAERGLPVLDADGMGRAFPEMQMETFSIYGISGSPMSVVNEFGDGGVLHARDDHFGEQLLRQVGLAMGGSCFCAQYVMSGAEAKRVSVSGSISLAAAVGRLIAGRRGDVDGFVDGLRQLLAPTEYGVVVNLAEGKIVDIERRIVGGYDQGEIALETFAGSRRLAISVKNEYLTVVEGDRPLAMVPDLVCIVDVDTLEPITAERIRYGQRVCVLGIGAPAILTTDVALAVVGPRGFGFDFDFEPLAG